MTPRVLSLLLAVLLPAAEALAQKDNWWPIDLSDPALKAPSVEREADAEGIFWDVLLDDAAKEGLVFHHYLRIKVFTERGRELVSKVDIPYFGDFRIEGIVARTIKPDGSIIEIKKEDIFERTIVKVSGAKVNAKSFVLSGIEPGTIVEYRWQEVRPGRIAYYIRLPFQRNIPLRSVTYHFRQNPRIRGAAMSLAHFNMPPVNLVPEQNLFFRTTMANVPAFREEPLMPPEDALRSWMLVFYAPKLQGGYGNYWREFGKNFYEIIKPTMKVSDDLRAAAEAAIGTTTVPEEKLQRLYQYCRTKTRNLGDVTSDMTSEDRANQKKNKSASDTLKHGVGNPFEINLLFAALANAAGFDVRATLSSDRSNIFFDPGFSNPYFLSRVIVAVRVGNQWRFFDPGNTFVPYGMLRWTQEGQKVLLSDPAEGIFVETPLSPAEKSKQVRSAKFRLSGDGTLEGDVRVEYTGHLAIEWKNQHAGNSPAQWESTLRDELKIRMSNADLSNIRFENAKDPINPLVYSYHVRIPGYAQRTGKRIFVQPAFFQRGSTPLFSASSRKHAIYFSYPWSEVDEVTIESPTGFVPVSLDPLDSTKMGDTSAYNAAVFLSKEGSAFTYRRSFIFRGEGAMPFKVNRYPELKEYFELLRQRDDYTITLEQVSADPAN